MDHRNPAEIEPARLYPLKEAAQFIPSARAGTVTYATLLKWAYTGHIKAVSRAGHHKKHWFIQGQVLLQFIGFKERPTHLPPSAAQRERDHNAAVDRLRAAGWMS